MGFNSVVVILNDRLSEMERDQRFGMKISEAVRGWPSRDRDRWATRTTGVEVISQAHADYPQVVVVCGNTGYTLMDKNVPDDLLKEVADQLREHGYSVHPPKRTSVSGP